MPESPREPCSQTTLEKLSLIALLALSFSFYLGKSYEVTLRGIDSNIHAKVALNATSGGIRPSLPIFDPNTAVHRNAQAKGEPPTGIFNDHPFTYLWINGLIMRIFEPSAWSARLTTASFSVLNVYLTFLIGQMLHSTLLGLLAAALCLLTRDLILTGATFSLDPPMLCMILLSYICFIKNRWNILGFVSGVGLWIKTPVVLLIYPVAMIFLFIQKKEKHLFLDLLKSFLLCLFVGSWVWIYMGMAGGWNWVGDYWSRQFWGTAIKGRQTWGHSTPWAFRVSEGLRVLSRGFLPGLPFLILGSLNIIKYRLWKEKLFKLSSLSIGVLFFAITAMPFSLGHYYNPAFPFLALLTALTWVQSCLGKERKIYLAITATSPILLSILLSCPISFGPEAFIALRKFIPIVQTYSDCDEKILLVAGGEPVGSVLDYSYVLNFYADRQVEEIGCEDVSTRLDRVDKDSAVWIVLSNDHYSKCVSTDLKDKLRTYLMGTQFLITNTPETRFEKVSKVSNKIIDLTWLDRELKASLGCSAPAFTLDRYHRYLR